MSKSQIFPIIHIPRDASRHILLDSPTEPIVFIGDRRAIGPINLNQLVLHIPVIGRDGGSDFVRLGRETPIVVIRVGE